MKWALCLTKILATIEIKILLQENRILGMIPYLDCCKNQKNDFQQLKN